MFDLWGRPGDTQPSLITETHSLWVLNGEWEIMEVPFWPGEYQTKHNPQEPVVRMGRIQGTGWSEALDRAIQGHRTMNRWERLLADDPFDSV